MPDDLLSELVSQVEAEGAVFVVQLTLLLIAEDGVGVVDFLKLELESK